MKLTGCADDQFTCNDGQCINIKARCDQIMNCQDESDEQECSLLDIKEGYNKVIPPFQMVFKRNVFKQFRLLVIIKDDTSTKIRPTEVKVSTSLKTVIEISERNNIIELKFEIKINWYEFRVKYYNVKENSALNMLSENELKMLWLPYIIFEVGYS